MGDEYEAEDECVHDKDLDKFNDPYEPVGRVYTVSFEVEPGEGLITCRTFAVPFDSAIGEAFKMAIDLYPDHRIIGIKEVAFLNHSKALLYKRIKLKDLEEDKA